MLLQCLAALLLLGDPLGLEGCQHSVQPQPLQALWARREAKCSERVLRLPAQEDSGKRPGAGPRETPSSCQAKAPGLVLLLRKEHSWVFQTLDGEQRPPPGALLDGAWGLQQA